MPIYSRVEFQEKYTLTKSYISTNKGRGTLVFQGKFIDMGLPENKLWEEKWEAKNQVTPEVVPVAPPKKRGRVSTKRPARRKGDLPDIPDVPPLTNPLPKKELSDFELPPIDSRDAESLTRSELDTIKKRIDIKKAQEELELAIIKKEKQLGLVIPTELVYGVFSRHFKSITDSFYRGLDNAIIQIAHELGGDDKALAKLRSGIVSIINESVEESKETSKMEVDAITEDYMEVRGRGERK